MKLKLHQEWNVKIHSCATYEHTEQMSSFPGVFFSQNRRCVCVNYPHNSNLNVLIHSKVTVRGLEIHTSIFPTPSNAKAASIDQLSLFMLILQIKFCLLAQLFGLRFSWVPWSLSYSSEMLYKGYSRHYLTTTWSWGWEKKGEQKFF